MVRSATFKAISRPLDVAVEMAWEADVGRMSPMSSMGLPTIFVRRAARP